MPVPLRPSKCAGGRKLGGEGPIKSKERGQVKIDVGYGGDTSQLGDMIRGTLKLRIAGGEQDHLGPMERIYRAVEFIMDMLILWQSVFFIIPYSVMKLCVMFKIPRSHIVYPCRIFVKEFRENIS